MTEEKTNKPEICNNYHPVQEYTHVQEIIDNLPYIIMTLLGAVIHLVGLGFTVWGWIAATCFALYGIAGAVWFIVFICPFCHFYGTRTCPCGYGQISGKLVPAQDGSQFIEKFKKHIPVIFPLWFVPLISGALFLFRNYNPTMLVLYSAFIINSFIILPLVSRFYGCAHCPQKNDCPWMKKK